MSFVYDPATNSCHDAETGITGKWAGGGGPTEDRCFQLSHSEWMVRICFYLIEEHDIVHDIRVVDRIPMSATTTYGANPYVQFAQSIRSIERSGTLDSNRDVMDAFHEAITCLYSEGGRYPVEVRGVAGRRPRSKKAAP